MEAKLRLRVYCPAKLNRFLAVGPRDSRGYHPLRTIFQAVGLYDILYVEFGDSTFTEIEVVNADLPANNTVSKALRLGAEVFAIKPSRIRLEKHIPIEAGLGGGSSDAAGVLRALNFVRPVPLEEIEAVASAIGADVPFFLTGGRAKGTGYGDKIEALSDSPTEWFLLVKPEVGCSTPEMFAKLDQEPRTWRDWPTDNAYWNDFERVAPPECLALIQTVSKLGALEAGLAGSGSSIFGRFETEEAARSVAAGFPASASNVIPSLSRAESLRIDRVST